mmetsp:Transcript_7077/g.22306  ORF Transcript_7077/g.22306 Transcript_7077/m.22306 type:complete len:223 (+) Transcript_7077:176-844(+)
MGPPLAEIFCVIMSSGCMRMTPMSSGSVMPVPSSIAGFVFASARSHSATSSGPLTGTPSLPSVRSMSSRRERVHPFDVGAAVQACPKRVDVTVSARVVEHRSVAAHYGDCVAEELGRSARSPAAAARSAQTRACAPSLRERGTRSVRAQTRPLQREKRTRSKARSRGPKEITATPQALPLGTWKAYLRRPGPLRRRARARAPACAHRRRARIGRRARGGARA